MDKRSRAPRTAVLTRAFRAGPGVTLNLSHYPGEERQGRHEHDHTQVSFLLAGNMKETIGRSDHQMIAPAVCIKPAGIDHANHWGKCGTLILSIRMREWDKDIASSGPLATWARTDIAPLGRLAGAALRARDPAEIEAIVDDLLASLEVEKVPSRQPPPWLSQVRDAIAESNNVTASEAARMAGVHRVHLSRSFSHYYGIPLNLFRRRVMLARAVEAALRSAESLAEVALLAGFADQSHMNRAINQTFGTTPKRLRHEFERHAFRH